MSIPRRLFLILFLVFGSWVLWERNRDALAGIDFYSGKVELSHDTTYNLSFEEIPERTYRHITLTTEYLGNIEAFISEPTVIPTEGIPVVIIMGGLEVDALHKKLEQKTKDLYLATIR